MKIRMSGRISAGAKSAALSIWLAAFSKSERLGVPGVAAAVAACEPADDFWKSQKDATLPMLTPANEVVAELSAALVELAFLLLPPPQAPNSAMPTAAIAIAFLIPVLPDS